MRIFAGETKEVQFKQFMDRSEWGEGEWDNEPFDRIYWEDRATGYPCILRRGPSGAWCGYVGVGKEHPLYGHGMMGEDEEKEEKLLSLDVHGGVTYTEPCQEDDKEYGVCHLTEGEDDRWWIGFDCGHAFDIIPRFTHIYQDNALRLLSDPSKYEYKNYVYAGGEVLRLAVQLSMMEKRENV